MTDHHIINDPWTLMAEMDEDDDLNDFIRELLIGQRYLDPEGLLHAYGITEVDSPIAQDYVDRLKALDREGLTTLALSQSLCPLHFVDYAICFDDLDPQCEAIRKVHPDHDT